MPQIDLDSQQILALARLIEATSDAPAILYPVVSQLRSRGNLDRCDECGRLDEHRALASRGDVCICAHCAETAHPYRSRTPIAARLDAEEHDIPAFMAGRDIALD